MTTQANKNSKKQKTEAEKQAAREAREAREAKRVTRVSEAARKASAWEQARGVVNKAGAHEKAALLCAADYCNHDDDKTSPAYATLYAAVYELATPDLRAVLAAVPAHVLAKAVRADGSLKIATIARAMAREIAANPQTALAVAQAAHDAQRKADRKARKAAKKAAQGKAGAK